MNPKCSRSFGNKLETKLFSTDFRNKIFSIKNLFFWEKLHNVRHFIANVPLLEIVPSGTDVEHVTHAHTSLTFWKINRPNMIDPKNMSHLPVDVQHGPMGFQRGEGCLFVRFQQLFPLSLSLSLSLTHLCNVFKLLGQVQHWKPEICSEHQLSSSEQHEHADIRQPKRMDAASHKCTQHC